MVCFFAIALWRLVFLGVLGLAARGALATEPGLRGWSSLVGLELFEVNISAALYISGWRVVESNVELLVLLCIREERSQPVIVFHCFSGLGCRLRQGVEKWLAGSHDSGKLFEILLEGDSRQRRHQQRVISKVGVDLQPQPVVLGPEFLLALQKSVETTDCRNLFVNMQEKIANACVVSFSTPAVNKLGCLRE